MEFSNELLTLAAKAEAALADRFAEIDRIAFENTQKVMALTLSTLQRVKSLISKYLVLK